MKRIEVKLPDELHAKFKGYCSKNYRTMHGQLLWMIEKSIEVSFNSDGQNVCEVLAERRKHKDRRIEDIGGGNNRREGDRRQSFLAPSSFEEGEK